MQGNSWPACVNTDSFTGRELCFWWEGISIIGHLSQMHPWKKTPRYIFWLPRLAVDSQGIVKMLAATAFVL